jgi:hypothetical protein
MNEYQPTTAAGRALIRALRDDDGVIAPTSFVDSAIAWVAHIEREARLAPETPSRDTEIERLREALAMASEIIEANPGEDMCRHGRDVDECDGDDGMACIDRSRRDALEGRSQPASEPSLDVRAGELTKAVMDVTDEHHLGIYATEGGASWFDRRRFALLLADRLAKKP